MGKYANASKRTPKFSSDTYRDDWVYVGRSIFIKGHGLFAAARYVKGDVIQEYKGEKISDKQADFVSGYCKKYLFDVNVKNKTIFVINSCDKSKSSAARYINSTLNYTDTRRNAHFVQYKKKIYIVATKTIPIDKEILAFYGPYTFGVIHST